MYYEHAIQHTMHLLVSSLLLVHVWLRLRIARNKSKLRELQIQELRTKT